MHVKFGCVNEIEAMHERPQVSVKVEPRSTFTLTRQSPHIASILFTRVKLRDSGNQLFGNGGRRFEESNHFLR